METYLLSLAAGILVGVVYSLLKVRSPAPPLIALLGLLGMLIGEQAIPSARLLLSYSASPAVSHHADTAGHLSGVRPDHALLQTDRGLVGNKKTHS